MVGFKVKIFGQDGTEIVNVTKSHLLVGRASHCDIQFDTAADEHLRIWFDGGHLWSQDLGSKLGTKLNGTPLQPLRPTLFQSDDAFKFGEKGITLSFQIQTQDLKPALPDLPGSIPIEMHETLVRKLSDENHHLQKELDRWRDQAAKQNADPAEEEEVSQVKLNALSEVKEMKTAEARRFETWKKESIGELERQVTSLIHMRPGAKISKEEACSDLSGALRSVLLGEKAAKRRPRRIDTSLQWTLALGFAAALGSAYMILIHRPARHPASVTYVPPRPPGIVKKGERD